MNIKQFFEPDRKIMYCGDVVTFSMSIELPVKGKAYLRTNIGKSAVHYNEIVQAAENERDIGAPDWYDVEMEQLDDRRFLIKTALTEVGIFSAKVWFLSDGDDKPQWADGENITFKVEDARNAGGNLLYSLFVRQFGPNLYRRKAEFLNDEVIRSLDEQGYTVIPPSGTFRSVIQKLDFIIGTLNSRIIQLLPIHPTPTVYGRMGRFGSAFASLDYFGVDPALAEFDKKTTPLGQFIELLDAVHSRGARVFMDIPVNHTGWASCLHTRHPEWFVKDDQNSFVSPGAWGIEWADLSQLDYTNPEVYQYMADVFLYWLRLGVDGFRCDAGYKLPYEAWQYINAKIRLEYPDAVLLLEGLGGLLDKQEKLLRSAGLNWAYSELFQNYDRGQIESYAAYADRINRESGLMVHYAETHDNNRLAAVSPSYAKMRLAVSALLSYNGSFGITNGVEWLAQEKVDVHGASGLNWGSDVNLVDYVRRLQSLLLVHPLFYQNTRIRFVNRGNNNTIVLLREREDLPNALLVIINLDGANAAEVLWSAADFSIDDKKIFDLLSGEEVEVIRREENNAVMLAPHQARCLTVEKQELLDLTAFMQDGKTEGALLREQRFYAEILKIIKEYGGLVLARDFDISEYAELLRGNQKAFWRRVSGMEIPPLIRWNPKFDANRVVLLPQNDLLLVEYSAPFRAEIRAGEKTEERVDSLPLGDGHFAVFRRKKPAENLAEYRKINIVLYEDEETRRLSGTLLLLPEVKDPRVDNYYTRKEVIEKNVYVIAANNMGGMSQIRADWGYLHSKYDALLAANCHAELPVDRRVMFTRCRAWMVYNDYSQEINLSSLESFIGGADNRAQWNFAIQVGQGKQVLLTVHFEMADSDNAVRLTFFRNSGDGSQTIMDDKIAVKLILRPDIENRINHEVTKAYLGAETSYPAAVEAHEKGFVFHPEKDIFLELRTSSGRYIPQPEWEYMEFLKEENERGLEDHTDLFSPGYFELHLKGNEQGVLDAAVYNSAEKSIPAGVFSAGKMKLPSKIELGAAVKEAMKRFIVKRDRYKTVIAGYPWFLDWGRDTLIALRGMISAGYLSESRDIIIQFASFEEQGTIPNVIRGGDVSNRETADAPLLLFAALEDYIEASGDDGILQENCGGRMLLEVLESILNGYEKGTPNGIKMDRDSGLIFSPAHFTWMDTNYPAGTPREGYPVEIQVFWAAALRFMMRYKPARKALYEKAAESFVKYFWMDDKQYLADCLHASAGMAAADAVRGDAVRPNQLFAVTFNIISDKNIQIGVINSCEQLLIPGAIRSLADLPVEYPLPVYRDGAVINDERHPYWGRYEGDEDTRRKPAYHNGTAWTWPFPSYCEALYAVCGERVKERALSILLSAGEIIDRGCAGQLPEVLDGDAPHILRGCGAQAWGVTEFFRVYNLLMK